MDYQVRAVDSLLDDLMESAAAISLDGPKGVGKTNTAMRRANSAWLLDDRDRRALLEADPSVMTSSPGTVLLDEWQLLPPVWDLVRRDVDAGAPAGRYLLTGSASPASARGTHSGAGRILSLRLRPMAIFERGGTDPTISMSALMSGDAPISGETTWGLSDYLREITRSGFPGLLDLPDRVVRLQLDSYLTRIIDRDIPELGTQVRRPETLRRWIAAYAAASSTTTTFTKITEATTGGDGTSPAKTTAISYRDHLTQLFLLDEVPAWSPSRVSLGRLQQAPKHQLADPALAARAMSLTASSLASPRGAHMVGPLFESLATLSVRVASQAVDATTGHLRGRDGTREVDLIAEGPDGQIVAFEVKLSRTVRDEDVRHLLWLREQMPEDIADLVVLTTGPTAYRRKDGVAVVPLALLGV